MSMPFIGVEPFFDSLIVVSFLSIYRMSRFEAVVKRVRACAMSRVISLVTPKGFGVPAFHVRVNYIILQYIVAGVEERSGFRRRVDYLFMVVVN